jgi:aminocarboxymuconate-semialdehyde decarboxylase
MTRVIDAHAHVLSEDTIAILQREVPALAPKLTPIDADSAILETPDVVQNPFPRGAWDLERRLADMRRFGFDHQVVAVCPQTLLYGAEAGAALAVAQIQNDQISAMCRAMPETFTGLATAPMQDPDRAAAELTRAMALPGIAGVMIGTNIKGRNLDDPALEPFWEAAAQTGAFILVHPVHVAGIDRQRDYYLKNIIGNPLDTTIAAACLIFGGVLERWPGLKVCLSHGGGFVPYQAGRFMHGWRVRDEGKKRLKGSPQEGLDRLIYDSILHAEGPLRFLIEQAGADRVVLGSDYPFDMGQYDMTAMVKGLGLPAAEEGAVLSGSAARLLGIDATVPAAAAGS